MIGYHLSNPIFRGAIASEGLIPQTGESYKHNHGEDVKPAIFFSLSNSDDPSVEVFDSTYDDDLYEMDLTDITLIQDRILKAHVMTYEKVPLDQIKLIHEGTGECSM